MTTQQGKIKVIPLTIKEANKFVKQYHRHNSPVTGGRFAIGAELNGELVGVAIAGRTIARLLHTDKTLEILRVCTDGTAHVNSFLFAKVNTIGKMMGYEKIITYTLKTESGASLRAVGAVKESEIKPQSWNRKNRERREQEVYYQEKIRWSFL